jgi:hypothetical protein
MTEAAQIELIKATPAYVGSIAAVLGAWFAYRAGSHAKDAAENSKTAAKNSDGMKEQLLRLTETSAHAEGKLEGKAEQKQESSQ